MADIFESLKKTTYKQSEAFISINKILVDYVKTQLSTVDFSKIYEKILCNEQFRVDEYNIDSDCVTGWIDRMMLTHLNYRTFNKEKETQWFCGYINTSCGNNYDDNLNYGIENMKEIKIFRNIEDAINNYKLNICKNDSFDNLCKRRITIVIGWTIKTTDTFPIKCCDIRNSKKDNYDTILTDKYIFPLNKYQYIPIGCFNITLLLKYSVNVLIKYCYENNIMFDRKCIEKFNIKYVDKNIFYTDTEVLNKLLYESDTISDIIPPWCYVCLDDNAILKSITCSKCNCKKVVHMDCLYKCYKEDHESSFYYNCDLCRCVTGNRIGKNLNDECYKLHLQYPLIDKNKSIECILYIYKLHIDEQDIHMYMILPGYERIAQKCFEEAFRHNALSSNIRKFRMLTIEDYPDNNKLIEKFINTCIEWGCGISSFDKMKYRNYKRKRRSENFNSIDLDEILLNKNENIPPYILDENYNCINTPTLLIDTWFPPYN